MYDILRQNSSRVKNREISPLPFIYGPREDDTDTNNPPRRENFHRYGMVGTDWKFSRSIRFQRWGETMANFSKVQDFANRTIHEYTGWVQAITLITLNFLRALFPHNANKLLRMKVASRNIIPLSMNRVFKRVFKVSRFFYPSSLNGIYFQL